MRPHEQGRNHEFHGVIMRVNRSATVMQLMWPVSLQLHVLCTDCTLCQNRERRRILTLASVPKLGCSLATVLHGESHWPWQSMLTFRYRSKYLESLVQKSHLYTIFHFISIDSFQTTAHAFIEKSLLTCGTLLRLSVSASAELSSITTGSDVRS